MIPYTRLTSPDDRQDRTHRVERARRRVLRVRHDHATRDQRDDHDGDVHQEDRAPPEMAEEPAADDGSDRDAQAGHAGPDADRAAALLGREHVREDRQGRRHDQRAADAHERPRADQRARRSCERRQDRADPEDHEADGERVAATVSVREAPCGEQQPREDQHVGIDHPLQLAGRGVEVTHERGERDVQDGVVESDHQQAEAEDPEDPPPAFVPFGVLHGEDSFPLRGRFETAYPPVGDSATPPYRNPAAGTVAPHRRPRWPGSR